jgi:hypothetical protein
MTRARPLFTVLLLAAAACRGGSSSDDVGDDDGPDSGVDPNDVSIYDVQGDLPVDGTQFDVRGVVVTAVDRYGERTGNIWVQEPDGGAYSGVLVYGVPLTVVDELVVGDIVDIEHVVKDEFALPEDTSGRTTTELVPPEGGEIVLTVVDSGDPLEAATVDPLAIGQLTTAEARDAEWEKWEGVLIRIESVTVLEELDQIGSEPEDPPFEEFKVTGITRVDTSLAALEAVTLGDCIASITGIGDYFFNYKVLPRETAAVVGGGEGCPTTESACDDGVDNDANGYPDCDDNNCIEGCTSEATVEQVQDGTIADGSLVSLTGVHVIAIDDISDENKGFWVADALQAAAYQGVYVYTRDALPVGISVGDTADITGEVQEFDLCSPQPCEPEGDPLTEINGYEGVVTIHDGTGTPEPLTGVTAATLSDLEDGEPYEGVYVQIEGPALVTDAQPDFDQLTVTTASGTILVEDESYNYSDAQYPVGTCFSSVTGVMDLNVFNNYRRLAPTRVEDLPEADVAECAGL